MCEIHSLVPASRQKLEPLRRTAVNPNFRSHTCAGVPLQSKLVSRIIIRSSFLEIVRVIHIHLNWSAVGPDISSNFKTFGGSNVRIGRGGGMQDCLTKDGRDQGQC